MKKRVLAIILAVMMVVVFTPTLSFGASQTDCPGGESCNHEAAITSGAVTTHYDTLAEAVTAAVSGNEIDLLKDVNLTGQIDIPAGKSLTLDLAGKKISYTGAALAGGVLLVHNGAELIVDDSAVGGSIDSGDNAYAAVSMTKQGDDPTNPAKLTVNKGELKGCYYAVVGNGNRDNTEITINGGTLKGTKAEDNLGIYHPQNGTLTVNNGTITGNDSAIEMRAGTLDINGGTFLAASSSFSCIAAGSGSTTKGAAVAIAQHTTKKDIAVDISGGTFTGVKAVNEANPEGNTPASKVAISISGGTFNGEISTEDVSHFISGGAFSSKVTHDQAAAGFVPTQKAVSGYYGVEAFTGGTEIETNTVTTESGMKSADVIIDKTDAAKYSQGTEPGTTVTFTLTATRAEETADGAEEIKKALSTDAGQTISYYVNVDLKATAGQSVSHITETSAYQILTFAGPSGSNVDYDKIIVYRQHGTVTDAQVEQLNKVTSGQLDGFQRECYCVNKTKGEVYVKANRFSVYGIGTQTKDPAVSCAVTYDSMGGSSVAGVVVDAGSKLTKPADPAKEGYAFKGWYKESDCRNAWNFEEDSVAADTTLYAKWVKVYTVEFDANGHGEAPADQNIEEKALVKEPAAPTAAGYVFAGWYKESACIHGWNFETDVVTSDVILYARWQQGKDISGCDVNLSATAFKYNGKVHKPLVKSVTNGDVTIPESGYTVEFESDCTAVGLYKVTVTGVGEYTGTTVGYFEIDPSAPVLKSVSKGRKAFTARWSKNAAKITKYQVQYSGNKSFKGSTTKTRTCSAAITKTTVKNLAAKKTYYVKVRAYTIDDGYKCYSAWSKTKKVIVK